MPEDKRPRVRGRVDIDRLRPRVRRRKIQLSCVVVPMALIVVFLFSGGAVTIRDQVLKVYYPDDYARVQEARFDAAYAQMRRAERDIRGDDDLDEMEKATRILRIYERFAKGHPGRDLAALAHRQAQESYDQAHQAQRDNLREFREKGFHCLSQWDGAHAGVRRYVRERMRDPESFEHIKTYIRRVDAGGKHALKMQYRSRNGFGGMGIGTATAVVDTADCSFIIKALQ